MNYLFLTTDGADDQSVLSVEAFNAVDEQNDYEVRIASGASFDLELTLFHRFLGPYEILSRTTESPISLPKNLRNFATRSTSGHPRLPFFGTLNANCNRYSVFRLSREALWAVDCDFFLFLGVSFALFSRCFPTQWTIRTHTHSDSHTT